MPISNSTHPHRSYHLYHIQIAESSKLYTCLFFFTVALDLNTNHNSVGIVGKFDHHILTIWKAAKKYSWNWFNLTKCLFYFITNIKAAAADNIPERYDDDDRGSDSKISPNSRLLTEGQLFIKEDNAVNDECIQIIQRKLLQKISVM